LVPPEIFSREGTPYSAAGRPKALYGAFGVN
jgi:hypothetical protein